MATVEQDIPPLDRGDFMTRDEFLRRWEAMPQLKRAELIRGIVYIPSRVAVEHSVTEGNVNCWLGVYKAATPGCSGAFNATWLMGEQEVTQPDVSLIILPECGGQSSIVGGLASGAPELVAEVCPSAAAYDLHQKAEVYEEVGVREYVAILMFERQLRWHRLTQRRFKVVAAPADGIYRSALFPGLRLDAAAFLAKDMVRVLDVLQEGIRSPEHAEFVQRLAARHKGS